MKTSFLSIFALALFGLILPGCGQKKSFMAEESFLGEWYTIKGDVEAYSFLKDDSNYIFVGTQGMRPVVYGIWKIEKEKFIISMDNGTTTGYTFVLSNDTLTFNEGDEIYTRTPPIEVKYPEVRILIALTSDLSDIMFSEPQPADLNWGYWVDSIQTVRNFSLKGYSITAGSTLSSGDVSTISDYLKDYGFESDTLFMTEICDGYWDDNQIITICTNMDFEAENDSIDIKVTTGLIVK